MKSGNIEIVYKQESTKCLIWLQLQECAQGGIAVNNNP